MKILLGVVILVVVGVVVAQEEEKERPYLPYPQGPFYGLPFDGKGRLSRFLPFSMAGKCEANATYSIKSVAQFFEHLGELECIFAGGRAPEKMPEGALYAIPLTSMNTRVLNPIVEFIWRGKFIENRECNGSRAWVGWNAWELPLGPTLHFLPVIKPHGLNLSIGEHKEDLGPGVVVEYHNDVLKACPELKNELQYDLGPGGASAANYWSRNIPFMDFIRFVGRQEDGGDLYILKTFLRDWWREDRMATTAAFTAVLNYDPDANPSAYPGIYTKPVEKEFTYLFPGLVDMLLRGLPFDNLLITPQQTWAQLRREGAATRMNIWSLLRDIPLSYRRIWKYNKQWLKYYDQDKKTHGEARKDPNNYFSFIS